jgi:hypothetical protein
MWMVRGHPCGDAARLCTWTYELFAVYVVDRISSVKSDTHLMFPARRSWAQLPLLIVLIFALSIVYSLLIRLTGTVDRVNLEGCEVGSDARAHDHRSARATMVSAMA